MARKPNTTCGTDACFLTPADAAALLGVGGIRYMRQLIRKRLIPAVTYRRSLVVARDDVIAFARRAAEQGQLPDLGVIRQSQQTDTLTDEGDLCHTKPMTRRKPATLLRLERVIGPS